MGEVAPFPVEPRKCTACHATGRLQITFLTRRKSRWKACPMCDGLGWLRLPWLRLEGAIDHVITMSKGGWHTTACGDWTPNGDVLPDPKRRCRACVDEMKRIGGLRLSEQLGAAHV